MLELTQAEADALIAMEKHRANEDQYDFRQEGRPFPYRLYLPTDVSSSFSIWPEDGLISQR